MIFSFRRPQYFTSHTGFSWSPVTWIVTWAWVTCGFGGFNMATASPPSSSSSSSFITTTVRDLGNLQQLSKKEKAFLTEGIKDKKLFPPLPTPDEDAWLTSHTETQQSHAAWSRKFQSVVTAASQNNKICLVPLGDEWTESEVDIDKSSKKESFLSLLQRFAAAFFTGELCWLLLIWRPKLACKNSSVLFTFFPEKKCLCCGFPEFECWLESPVYRRPPSLRKNDVSSPDIFLREGGRLYTG